MITVQDVEGYTLQEIADEFEPQVEQWIGQMTKYIETYTGRTFSEADEATERVYDGNNRDLLMVDDFTELETVEAGDREIEVKIHPANTLPKYALYTESRFPRGRQNITVTAKWGYGLPPEDIKHACTVLVSGIVQAHTGAGIKASESIGNYSVSYTSDAQRQDHERAMSTLKAYRLHTL
jgi:hypothetical protein